MIALFSALLGFISSALPDFLRLIHEGKDRAHEVTLLKLQMEYAAQNASRTTSEQEAARLERSEAIASTEWVAEQTALNARVKDSLTGIIWVDGLSGSVRPVLTYAFFALYAGVKTAQFGLLTNPHLPWATALSPSQALVALWTEEDIAIFSAVIAFWFGSRTMGKGRR